MFILLSLLNLVFADTELIEKYPREVLRNEIVQFRPKSGHHFSMEAPQKCAGRSPVKTTARNLKCQFLNPGKATAVLNVCDDQKTFCKPITLNLNVAEVSSGEPVRLLENQNENFEVKKKLVPGFKFLNPAELKKEARSPVFLMISTDWCPPCNEAKEILFPTKEFQEATRDWLKVYVDGDSLAAVEWEKLVSYWYYPTFVLLNSNLEEIARYNGRMQAGEFSQWAREQKSFLNDPLSSVESRVLARLEGRWWRRALDWVTRVDREKARQDELRLLRFALDQKKDDLVARLLEKDTYPELQLEVKAHQLRLLEESGDGQKEQKVSILKDILEVTLNGSSWSAYLSQLCHLDVEACRMYEKRIADRLEFLNQKKNLSEMERASLLADEHYYLTQVYGVLKREIEKRLSAKTCVQEVEKFENRSLRQVQAACLVQADEFAKAEVLYKALIQEFPKEPTFRVSLARLYRKRKKFEQALKAANEAEDLAYGFNWYSLQLLKSDILMDLQRAEEALEVVRSALHEVRITGEEDRYQQVVSRFRSRELQVQEKLRN